jgi:hypothetical protein
LKRRYLQQAATAAVVGQKCEQPIHGVEVGAVNDETAILARGNQAGMAQFLQVEGKRGRRQIQLLGYLACGEAIGTDLHQQPECRQP